jgi:antibiotic biosynthesis monooxygenase (ABM) superfamily enzyme
MPRTKNKSKTLNAAPPKIEDPDEILRRNGKAATVVVSRSVFPGFEKEYDSWVKQISDAARESPGNTGVTVLLPEQKTGGLHHVIFHFADEKSMHIWETSYVRQKLSHEADAFSKRNRQVQTGLETWFSIPECPELETPPHWKMAIVTWIGVFLGSCGILYLIDLFWTKHNFFVFNAVVGALLVSLLTWVVMPILSRYVFRKWLYKNR